MEKRLVFAIVALITAMLACGPATPMPAVTRVPLATAVPQATDSSLPPTAIKPPTVILITVRLPSPTPITPTPIKPPPISPTAIKPPTIIACPTPPLKYNISNLRPVDVSATELRITADYAYNGDHGKDNTFMAAYAWIGSRQVPGTGYVPGAVKVGKGIVTVSVKMTSGSGVYTSDTIRMCLYVGGGNSFYCENFAYKKAWKR